MNQGCCFPRSKILSSGILALLFAAITGCNGNPSPELTQVVTSTPPQEDCYWNWAYGSGSEDFDNAVMRQFSDQKIESSVKSSTYGEIYSCDQSYAAMSLDVKVELKVDDLQDVVALSLLADKTSTLLKENLPISKVSGLGNVNLTFALKDGSSTCFWNFSTSLCE